MTGVTVARLLDEPLFRDTLVAGASGTENTVTWCLPYVEPESGGPLDAADDLANAGVYLPFAALRGKDAGKVVRQLSEAGVAMLAVPAAGPVVRRDLQAAVESADAVALPLLAVGPKASFRETSRLIATKVLAQSTHVLEYGNRVHRILGDVFARGAGLSALAHTMAQMSGATVLIAGNNAELLAEASPSSDSGMLAPAAVERILELTGPPDRLGGTGHDHDVQVLTLDIDRDVVQVVVAPVRVAGDPYGTLILVEPHYPAAEHELAQHRVIAEQGVSLTVSELLRMHSVRQAEERARNDFVHALLHGRFTDQLELTARAQHYQLPVDDRFAVFIVTSPVLDPDSAPGRRAARDAERAVQSLPSEDLATLSAVIGSMIVVVRQLRKRRGRDRDPSRVVDELRDFGMQLHRVVRQRLRADVQVSYGRPFNGAAGIAKSYREARTAEGLSRRVTTDEVCSFADLRVFAAVEECAMSSSGQDFAAEVLAPLKQLDGQTGNLEELVLAYIEEGGNLNATARRLHLHRNTMLYKLERASRALQMDIRTPEVQFMVWLAHHIIALNDVVGALDKELSPPS